MTSSKRGSEARCAPHRHLLQLEARARLYPGEKPSNRNQPYDPACPTFEGLFLSDLRHFVLNEGTLQSSSDQKSADKRYCAEENNISF